MDDPGRGPAAAAARAADPPIARRRAAIDLGLAVLPLAAVAAAVAAHLARSPWYVADVLGLYTLLAALVLRGLPGGRPGSRPGGRPPGGLGAANRITLFRATLILPAAALALQAAPPGPAARWWIVGLSIAAMVLDGVDGAAARRAGGGTRFGARFDMELDAFLILALAVLVWRSGEAGPWVILIGAMRYLFVAAGRIWPALAADLPPSRRRKAVCVVQGAALLVCLGPIVPPVLTPLAAAGALALLVWSFALDTCRLWRRGTPPAPAARREARRCAT